MQGSLIGDDSDVDTIADRAICDPGPDVVICDEGHRIKNEKTKISQVRQK